MEHAHGTAFQTRDQDWQFTDVKGLVVTRVRNLAYMRHRVPVRSVEQALHFQLIDLRALVEHLGDGVGLGREGDKILDELGVGIHCAGTPWDDAGQAAVGSFTP